MIERAACTMQRCSQPFESAYAEMFSALGFISAHAEIFSALYKLYQHCARGKKINRTIFAHVFKQAMCFFDARAVAHERMLGVFDKEACTRIMNWQFGMRDDMPIKNLKDATSCEDGDCLRL